MNTRPRALSLNSGTKIVLLERDIEKERKFLTIQENKRDKIMKSFECNAQKGWFCNKPKNLLPKEGEGMKYINNSPESLKRYLEYIMSSINRSEETLRKLEAKLAALTILPAISGGRHIRYRYTKRRHTKRRQSRRQ